MQNSDIYGSFNISFIPMTYKLVAVHIAPNFSDKYSANTSKKH